MSEYIKRDDLIQKLMEEMCDFPESIKRELAEKSVAEMESIEVVHCRDCVKRGNICPLRVWCGPDDDDFCSKGERYESDNEDTVADTEDSH